MLPTDTQPLCFDVEEGDVPALGDLLALMLRRGDLVCLSGELGAGKTTLARALIRSALGDAGAEVPSPTFSLVQTYETQRWPVAHFDLYRLSEPEVGEIGIEEAIETGVAIIEWPERAGGALPPEQLRIRLRELDAGARRHVEICGTDAWAARVERLGNIARFLEWQGWSGARIAYMQGDASSRRYARLRQGGRRAILMDSPKAPDGPVIRDGKPYSRIAHLAEDVRPFVAIARHLRSIGISAPEVHSADLGRGLLVIEDLGDRVLGEEVRRSGDQARLWKAAVDVLLEMRRHPLPGALPVAEGAPYWVPPYDRGALQIEVELLADWYVPAITGAPLPERSRAELVSHWGSAIDRVLAMPKALVLRDFHSPNLIWLPERRGVAQIGVIDFQDALVGHAAYDLVSLLQDARLDVPAAIEDDLLAHYLRVAGAEDPDFDAAAFEVAYRTLGAQRNTKILGIFARLARRDGKPQYLAHIPRIWRYLDRDLEHAMLAPLRSWYDRVLPAELRSRPVTA